MSLPAKIQTVLEDKYNATVINVIAAGRAGTADIVAGINGVFYLFEVKDLAKKDRLSMLQKQKINQAIAKGNKAYVVYSTGEVQDILDNNIPPKTYDLGPLFSL